MSALRKPPPPAVIEAQHKASDPAVSAWVSANAGSGKTHVLTERVIRLLLSGTAPEKILCITFTKAAAANMATRVFDTLSEWIALDEAGLDARIEALGLTPSAAIRALARRLFAVAIETPGGLKVQTIHAFCTRLLHQFPFEAGVAARFNVLDEATETQLLEKLTLDVMLEGAANPGSALGTALQTAITAAADQTLRDVIRLAVGKRDAISGWISRAGSLAGAIAELSRDARHLRGRNAGQRRSGIFLGRAHSPRRVGRCRGLARAGTEERPGTGQAFRGHAQNHRAAAARSVAGHPLHEGASAPQRDRHEGDPQDPSKPGRAPAQ